MRIMNKEELKEQIDRIIENPDIVDWVKTEKILELFDEEEDVNVKTVPVEEKLYEVMTYMDCEGNKKSRYSDGRYKVHPDATLLNHTAKQCEDAGDKIWAVKRLSDNEIFTVGETISSRATGDSIEIDNFHINKSNNVVYANPKEKSTYWMHISNWQKIEESVEEPKLREITIKFIATDSEWEEKIDEFRKLVGDHNPEIEGIEYYHKGKPEQKVPEPEELPVLLVTEDGVSITDPQQDTWLLYPRIGWDMRDEVLAEDVVKVYLTPNSQWKVFSSLNARMEYISKHKPILSCRDIYVMGEASQVWFALGAMTRKDLYNSIEHLAKEKLKQ